MKGKAAWISLTIALVTLAGCADDTDAGTDGAIEGKVDEGEFQLKAGKGAISGLLVDDRFRPIDLGDDAQTEFQFTGFILLQETGEQVQTNENGEFSFVDLEPGEYTLRATIDQHEATPSKVTVEEGLFAESTVLARRVISDEGTVIVQQHTWFTACAAEAVAIAHAAPCSGADASGDSSRVDFYSNYTAYNESSETPASYMVTEIKFNQDLNAGMAIRYFPGPVYMAEKEVFNGNYIRTVNELGVRSDDGYRNINFTLDHIFQTIMFPHSLSYETTYNTYEDAVKPVLGCDSTFAEVAGACIVSIYGAGVVIGVEAQVAQTLFIGETAADVDSYCILCADE